MIETADKTIELPIDLPGPIDLAASLRPYGRWGDDGLDRWDGATLVRTVRLDAVVPYAAIVAGCLDEPKLLVQLAAAEEHRLGHIEAAIRGSFVSVPHEIADLAATDERVGRLMKSYQGIVPVLVTDPFAALIRSISAQQVNLRWATILRSRLAERYGTRHGVGGTHVYSLDAAPLAVATIEELRAIQLTTAKARSVIACAQAAVNGELHWSDLAAMEDDELIEHLTRLRGIGLWSAEWFLARTLGRPRVVVGDLGVRKAVGRMYGLGALPSENEVRRATGHWGASATVVQGLALYDLAVAEGNA